MEDLNEEISRITRSLLALVSKIEKDFGGSPTLEERKRILALLSPLMVAGENVIDLMGFRDRMEQRRAVIRAIEYLREKKAEVPQDLVALLSKLESGEMAHEKKVCESIEDLLYDMCTLKKCIQEGVRIQEARLRLRDSRGRILPKEKAEELSGVVGEEDMNRIRSTILRLLTDHGGSVSLRLLVSTVEDLVEKGILGRVGDEGADIENLAYGYLEQVKRLLIEEGLLSKDSSTGIWSLKER